MNHNIRNRQIEFTIPFPEGFDAKGWGATHRYNTLEVSVGYAEGGISYFSGERTERGFYLYLQPCNIISRESGFTSREFAIGTGGKLQLAPAARYNAKKLSEWATKVQPHAEAIAKAYIAGERETVMNLFAVICEFDGPPTKTLPAESFGVKA